MKKRKVIIDCDPGIDDSLAIMLALKSPEIEVIGISIVCGNSPVEMGFGNAKKILKQMNRLDVPIYIGESTPLRRDYVNALDTHGEDGLGESFLPEVIGYQQQISAVDFLADVLKKEKVSYRAKAEVTTCYFPDKRYGDIIFPEGNYEALRIVLGKGNGHNWWCVLYPNLCFTNATCAVVDEDGKKELKEALSAEEYEMVTATSEFKIKWFFFGKDHAKESD
mgnify:FL=1